jgi:hypothetical protein
VLCPRSRSESSQTAAGVRAERDLAEAASDFYVLELLTARGDPDAARMLSRFEAGPAKEFACCLDMANGRRAPLRHAAPREGRFAPRARLLSERPTPASAGRPGSCGTSCAGPSAFGPWSSPRSSSAPRG